MPLSNIDTGGVARCLAQIADRADDHVDAFFEVVTESRVRGVDDHLVHQHRVESGLAVRLLREGRTWLASCDRIAPKEFGEAVARVARARPNAVAPPPSSLGVESAAPAPDAEIPDTEIQDFVARMSAAIQRLHAAFPCEWDVSAHHRASRVVGAMVAPAPQEERFYSCAVRTPWGGWGSLLLDLDDASAERAAASLTLAFRARRALAPETGRTTVVLGPSAAAVLLHEAVAHVLETDTLALTGNPARALGVRLGSPLLTVADDPQRAAAPVRRSIDDEGMPVVRRFLLREGEVTQPLADHLAAGEQAELMPGAARRGSRHLPPVPRSTHLELVPPSNAEEELERACARGLAIPEFSRGRLDPLTGELELAFPYARRIDSGQVGALVGPGRVVGSVSAVLGAIQQVGSDLRAGGAGWCAKGGHRLPVWALASSLLVDGIEVRS